MGELDDRRGLGADQFPADPARSCLSGAILGAVAHIFEANFPDHERAAREANPACRLSLDLGGDWEALATGGDGLADPADVDRDDPAWFFYTSGTTGRPKAAILTHGQMAFVVTNHLCDLMPGTTEHDASLVVAPLSHGAGIHALTQVARGAVQHPDVGREAGLRAKRSRWWKSTG